MSTLTVVGKSPGDEELRLWLVSHMKEHTHLTSVVLARSDHIGGSRTMIDQYVEGTYFLPKDSGGLGVSPSSSKIERLVREYREKVEGTVRHGYANTFVKTFSWQQLVSAWKTCVEEHIIVVAYGKPGVGKSRCLTELSVKQMTTMPISILCSPNITVGYFVKLLARELGVSERLSIPQTEDLVAEKLKKNPRPIVVDQANYLNEKSLGSLCYLWERSRVPIMLVGTNDLFKMFTTSSLTEDVRAQLSSRVALHYPLQELGLSECKSILLRAFGSELSDGDIAQIHEITGGGFRSVDFMSRQLKRLMKLNKEGLAKGEMTITKLINTAASRMMTG